MKIPFEHVFGMIENAYLAVNDNIFTDDELKEFKFLIGKEYNKMLTDSESEKLKEYKNKLVDNSHIEVDYYINNHGEPLWEEYLD